MNITPKGGKHMWRSAGALALTVCAVLALWLTSPIKADSTCAMVNTARTKTLDMYDRVTVSGRVESVSEQKAYCPVSLVVTRVMAQQGDAVLKNQVLFYAEPAAVSPTADLSSALSGAGLSQLPDELGALLESLPVSNFTAQTDAGAVSDFSGYVLSPMDGCLSRLNVSEGDILPAGTLCAVITDVTDLQIRAQIPENDVGNLREGMPVNIEGDAFPDTTYCGTLSRIMPTADVTGGLSGATQAYVEALIEITGSAPLLKPGYSVDLYIFPSVRRNALSVPYSAITQDEQNRELVYVFDGDRVYKRYILTGGDLDDRVEVRMGLSPDETVVIDPPEGLKNGARAVSVSDNADH